MASLLSPAPSGPPRLSQLLPTVKCSSCNAPVALSELGDHVCKPAPPLPNSPGSTKSVASFLPTRLQNLVSPTSTSSPPSAPPPAPTGPAGQQRSSSLSFTGRNQRPERGPSPLSRGAESPSAVSPSSAISNPGSSDFRASARVPPARERTPSMSTQRIGTPSIAPAPNVPQRVVSPSAPGRAGPVPYPNRGGTPVDPRARTLSSPRREHPEPMSSPVIPPARTNTPTSPLVQPPSRTGTPATRRRGSNASTRVPFPSTAPPQIPLPRTPSTSSHMSTLSAYRHPSSPSTYTPPAPPPRTPPPPTPGTPKVQEPDTKTGGEAGMAGVGRRGFAAAVRAAMFATDIASHVHAGHDSGWGTPSMDGRRPNAPRFLDISTNALHSANTPPLSPNPSTHSSTHSPHSPYSPTTFPLASPNKPSSPSHSAASPAIASRTPSPASTFTQVDRLTQTPTPTPADFAKPPQTPSTPMTPSLPFFEKFKNKLPMSASAPGFGLDRQQDEPRALSPDPDSSSEYSGSGLAYADDTDEDEVGLMAPAVKPLAVNNSNPTSRVHFPSMSDNSETAKLDYSRSTSSSASSSSRGPANMPIRSISDASYTSSRMGKGALDRAMETLFEDPTSPTSSTTSASFGVTSTALAKSNTTANRGSSASAVKLPTRSHTSPTLHNHALGEGAKKRERKVRECRRCERQIDDGRWVRTDSGGVLCERCWKNMYLPKCRRCNLPIEKHAVSSSDGQLKGKYHRECFNCHTCHKPFPDKTFYVFDGKPFCAYHYHEANDSLCAAATCGQPIEGPCAVSHAGDRYHPEHLLCEYPRGCTEKLDEYYEVDGRMLCERHAFMRHNEDDEEDDGDRELKAMKRTTRFIDLTQFGGNGLR
ncbi:hypothetical protein NEOLEDRAFT_1177545 [Neolentinus lepideus HHB14362 ss-1]|uniref:LIM zinc-binding domain-containing protein n=1 Tax=Neolentinus lepideus HHB14362 ss-1 TaxID=1314782 RepID=A0A165TEH5_9AGAM|nr:hypothetical protein NEOLEDRAFT_1177545 [Neolentinus lepideus HHB14362 ss-1]